MDASGGRGGSTSFDARRAAASPGGSRHPRGMEPDASPFLPLPERGPWMPWPALALLVCGVILLHAVGGA